MNDIFQAFIVNDVELSPGPKTLYFDQHIEYIANHGNDQNDYVSQKIHNQIARVQSLMYSSSSTLRNIAWLNFCVCLASTGVLQRSI